MVVKLRLSLSKPDLHACGRLAVWNSMLDAILERVIWYLMELPTNTAIQLTHDMHVQRKIEFLKILTERLPSKDKKRILPFINDLDAVVEQRNLVIHGLWFIGDDGNPWVVKFSKKGRETRRQRLEAPVINAWADDTKKLVNGLTSWLFNRDPSVFDFPSRSKPGGKPPARPRKDHGQNPLKAPPTK